jgi:hypothetical protein
MYSTLEMKADKRKLPWLSRIALSKRSEAAQRKRYHHKLLAEFEG